MNWLTGQDRGRGMWLALLLAAVCVYGAARPAQVTTTGRGDTFKEAKQAARRKAIAEVGEKYLRLQQAWRTPEERAVVVESLLTVSDSFVKSFRVLERKERQGETWIRAKVAIDVKTLKAAISLIAAATESGTRRRHRLPKPPSPPLPGTNVPPPKSGVRPGDSSRGGGMPAREGGQGTEPSEPGENAARTGQELSDSPEGGRGQARSGSQSSEVRPPSVRRKVPRGGRRKSPPRSPGLEIEPLDF